MLSINGSERPAYTDEAPDYVLTEVKTQLNQRFQRFVADASIGDLYLLSEVFSLHDGEAYLNSGKFKLPQIFALMLGVAERDDEGEPAAAVESGDQKRVERPATLLANYPSHEPLRQAIDANLTFWEAMAKRDIRDCETAMRPARVPERRMARK